MASLPAIKVEEMAGIQKVLEYLPTEQSLQLAHSTIVETERIVVMFAYINTTLIKDLRMG